MHNIIETPIGVVNIDNIFDSLKIDAACFIFKDPKIILKNRIKGNEPDPLGLTSIRIYLTKEENITKINFTFIWRTVEAIVGFPYSAYGSIRYAEEFLNKLKELLPQGLKIHFGDLTYIAQTLHIFQDTYSENIAKNIIDEVTYY